MLALLLLLTSSVPSGLGAAWPPPPSEELRAWVRDLAGHRSAPGAMSQRRKAYALGRAIARTPERQLVAMGAPREAFGDRGCVAWASLVVGLARELGLPARYALTDEQRSRRVGWRRLVERHMVVTVSTEEGPLVFDSRDRGFRLIRAVRRMESIRFLDDTQALAVELSNRGANAILQGRNEQARQWLRAAVMLAPDLDLVRSNLAAAWADGSRPAQL